jgi:hypothetical protein
MLTTVRAREEIDDYCRRVDVLYGNVHDWIVARLPLTVFHRTPVQMNEEATGPYELESLEINLPGFTAVRFVPRGIFMVGARGRVDVRSRLGRQTLVWIEASSPAFMTMIDPGQETETVISRPLFRNTAEGWSWSDPKRTSVRPLNADVLWDQILMPLTR